MSSEEEPYEGGKNIKNKEAEEINQPKEPISEGLEENIENGKERFLEIFNRNWDEVMNSIQNRDYLKRKNYLKKKQYTIRNHLLLWHYSRICSGVEFSAGSRDLQMILILL